MKNSVNLCKGLLLLALGATVVDCSSSSGPAPAEERETANAAAATAPAKLDPLELPQDTRVVPQLQPRKGEIIGSGNEPVTKNNSNENKAVEPAKPIKSQVDSLSSQALRIQLHSTELFGEAKRERLVAEEIFDQPVYLDYEVPYYKVRVGNFLQRKEAESYLSKAKTAGYQNAWIVAVRVNVKEAQPLYENLPVPQSEAPAGK